MNTLWSGMNAVSFYLLTKLKVPRVIVIKLFAINFF